MNTQVRQIYSVLFFLTLALLGYLLYEFQRSPLLVGEALKDGAMSDAQKLSVEIMLDLSKTIASWTFAAMGAAAFVLKTAFEKSRLLSRVDVALTLTVLVLGTFSTLFAHLLLEQTFELLRFDLFPIGSNSSREVFRLQYLLSILAIWTLAANIIQFSWRAVVSANRQTGSPIALSKEEQ